MSLCYASYDSIITALSNDIDNSIFKILDVWLISLGLDIYLLMHRSVADATQVAALLQRP